MINIYKYKKISYLMQTPDNFSDENKYPLIIYLHGAGGRGDDINKISNHPYFNYDNEYKNSAITFFPQCYADTWFDIFEQLQNITEYIINLNYIDENRIYLMGASMGGYAVWQLAMSHPEWFAGIVPICGGGMYWNTEKLVNSEIWAFHGSDDDTVLPSESEKMVNKINSFGGHAKLTICKNTGHDSWINAFKDIKLFEWLFSLKKSDSETIYKKLDDMDFYG